MKEFQIRPAAELKAMLEEKGMLEKIRTGKLRRDIQWFKPARMKEGGATVIYSYYDRDVYVCTSHKLITLDGEVRHCDVKDCTIEGVRYKAPG